MDIDLVLQRLAQAMRVGSFEELATVLGKDVQTLRVWRHRHKVPPATIAYVAKASGKPVEWLEGDEHQAAHPASEPITAFFEPKKKQVNAQADLAEFFFVPEVDVRAGAGPGVLVDSEEIIGKFAFRRSWLRQKKLVPDQLAVVRARGDSMYPTVHDGDILLIDRAVAGVVADGIYLIEQANHLQCKRLQMAGDALLVKSDNPAYEDQRLTAKQAGNLRIAGRVIWVGGER